MSHSKVELSDSSVTSHLTTPRSFTRQLAIVEDGLGASTRQSQDAAAPKPNPVQMNHQPTTNTTVDKGKHKGTDRAITISVRAAKPFELAILTLSASNQDEPSSNRQRQHVTYKKCLRDTRLSQELTNSFWAQTCPARHKKAKEGSKELNIELAKGRFKESTPGKGQSTYE
ncbi:hypothetical protein RND71_009724 [Anisodus tanguticus]|uniref:Uncharacterized protein n=1 Tax=Anisodus tanguticus TaxID=243964 RepID=A0AAE1SIK4_9SOLA|nr:hypothetical protein RND71_009724 [Anisodus tanguticus]